MNRLRRLAREHPFTTAYTTTVIALIAVLELVRAIA